MKRLWDKRVLWFVRMEATARPSVPPAFDRFFTDPQCAQPLSPGCFEKLPMATKTQLDGETFLCKPAKSSLVIRRLQVPHAGIPSTRVLTRACPRVLSAQPCALTSPVRTRFVRLTLRCYMPPPCCQAISKLHFADLSTKYAAPAPHASKRMPGQHMQLSHVSPLTSRAELHA